MLVNNVMFGVDLADILTELQSQLKANNIPLLRDMKDTPDNIMITCPYHKDGQERKPSAGVKKNSGVFHCFTCGETHSLQEVISFCFGRYDDMLGVFGWEWLLKNFLTVSVEERKDVKVDCSRNTAVNMDSINYVSEEELDSYRNGYVKYMSGRGITLDVQDKFDIGYDKKSECVTFPVRDITGNTLFIARRSVNTKFFNYPAGVEKPVYGLYELSKIKPYPKEVYICESMIDALTIWSYGKYAVALNGLGNELQFSQLNKMPCRKFILATDNDDAGLTARKRLRKQVTTKLIAELNFPLGKKDINELSLEEFLLAEESF